MQLELKKVETLPGGGPGSKFTELIGAKPTEIWSVDDQLVGPDAGRVAGRGWAQLGVRDFPFKVAIPEGLPPSVVVDAKGGVGISYELCATLFARPKPRSKGLFHRSKDALEPDDATLEPVQITVAVPLRIVKHDLHSAWPIYHPDPPETKELEKNGVTIGVTRNTTAVGPGDELWTRVRVESEVVRPIRIIRFEISLREVIMFKYGSSSTSGGAGASNGNKEGGTGGRKTDQRMTTIFDVHAKLGKQLYHKEQHSFDIKSLVPSLSGSGSINGSSHQRLTVSTAKHLSIEYLLKVRAVVDGIPDNEIVVDFLPVTMGDRGWQEAQKTIERIGPVDKLMKPPKSTMKHVENRPHPGAVANQRRFAHQHPQNQTSTSGARGVQVQAPSSPPMPGQPGFPVGQSGAGRSRTSMPPMARSASGDAARTNRHTSMMFDSPAARASAGPGVRFSAHPDTRTISSSDGSSTIDAHDDPYQRRGPQPISSVAHKGDGVILDYGAQRSNRHSLELGVGSSIPPSSSEQRPSRSNQVRPIDAPPSSAAIAQRLRESKARIASFNAGSPSASPNRSASTSVHSESRDPSPVRNSGDRSKFATAEEEKKRLFEQAKRTAEKTQAEALARSTLMNGSNDATGQGSSAAGGKTRSYASAEEEKRRLFEEAKQEAERTQRGERSASDATIKAFSRAGASPDGVNESGSGERGGGGKQRTFESAEDEKKRYERARVQQEEAEERARQFYARQAQTPNGSSPAFARFAQTGWADDPAPQRIRRGRRRRRFPIRQTLHRPHMATTPFKAPPTARPTNNRSLLRRLRPMISSGARRARSSTRTRKRSSRPSRRGRLTSRLIRGARYCRPHRRGRGSQRWRKRNGCGSQQKAGAGRRRLHTPRAEHSPTSRTRTNLCKKTLDGARSRRTTT